MNKAAAHGKVRRIKNVYVPKQRTEAELDALQAELVATALRKGPKAFAKVFKK